jgi:hypothetical protein
MSTLAEAILIEAAFQAQYAAQEIAFLGRLYTSITQPFPTIPGVAGPWRPPQWTAQQAANQPSFSLITTDPNTGNTVAYVFDGILKAEHEQKVVTTQNPIQTGAAISDHVYVVPASVIIELLMSDSMQSFTASQFTDLPSRSVSCYKTLIAILKAKQPVFITTPLQYYGNMIVASVDATEDKDTRYTRKFVVRFQEVIFATVQTSNANSSATNSSAASSSIPQTTQTTLAGNNLPSNVPASVSSQNNIGNANPSTMVTIQSIPTIPAAGSWSSTNTSTIGTVFGG